MRKGIKYALVFTGGVAIGIGVCGVNLISYALSDEDIREGIKNKISRKIDKTLYGDEPNRRRHSSVSYSTYKNDKVSYINYYNDNWDYIIFESRKEAMKALDEMKDILEEYGFITVADMCDMADLPAPYTSNKYGWTNLSNAEVVRVRMGYKISLQKPTLLD